MRQITLIVLSLLHLGHGRQAELGSALANALLDGYDKDIKPDGKVEVLIGMMLLDVDICPYKQVMTTTAWTFYLWNDTRLTWNATQFGGMNAIRIKSEKIWIPDISVKELVEKPQSIYQVGKGDPSAIVFPSGHVAFFPGTTQRTSCPVNYNNWPWGEQRCNLTFASWNFDKKHVTISPWLMWTNTTEAINLDEFRGNQVEITHTSHGMEDKKYDCCPEEEFPQLHMEISFKKTSIFYNNELVTPDKLQLLATPLE